MQTMKERGWMRYRSVEEGDITVERTAVVPEDVDRDRVTFMQVGRVLPLGLFYVGGQVGGCWEDVNRGQVSFMQAGGHVGVGGLGAGGWWVGTGWCWVPLVGPWAVDACQGCVTSMQVGWVAVFLALLLLLLVGCLVAGGAS